MLHYFFSRVRLAVRERWLWLLLALPVAAVPFLLDRGAAETATVTARIPVPPQLLDQLGTGSEEEQARRLLHLVDVRVGPAIDAPPAEQLFFRYLSGRRLESLGLELGETSPAAYVEHPSVRSLVSSLDLEVEGSDAFVLRYDGSDGQVGRAVVEHLSGRIDQSLRARAGLLGSTARTGEVTIESRSQATGPGAGIWLESIAWLAAALALLLLILVLAEMSSRKLTTEREVARYLGATVLGQMPPLPEMRRRASTSLPPPPRSRKRTASLPPVSGSPR